MTRTYKAQSVTVPADLTILWYCAGVWDGDGCFSRHSTNKLLRARVSMQYEVEKDVVDDLGTWFGLNRHVLPPGKGGTKSMYNVDVSGSGAITLARALHPLMAAKSKRRVLVEHWGFDSAVLDLAQEQSQHQAAYLAGLVNTDGSFSWTTVRGRKYPKLALGMIDFDPVKRFAVSFDRPVYENHSSLRKLKGQKPIHYSYVFGYSPVAAAAEWLWPWLSTYKRTKARQVLTKG